MNNILVLFAHPKFERSRVNKVLVERIRKMEGVTFHDLYERYPDYNIDIAIEKNLLNEHEIIVWQHPFYWYSCPPLMKQWIDVVLEFGWAYGPKGDSLKGKKIISSITTGGSMKVYCAEGTNNYPVYEFLKPFEQTARLCGMEYLPPFMVMGTHRLTEPELEEYVDQYELAIEILKDGIELQSVRKYRFFNDYLKTLKQTAK